MKVSIITVVYNGVDTIEDAINSVANQSYKLIEHIIIDGESTDGTISILNGLREKIAVFVSEPDAGIYDAMNKGLMLAKGDIIGILNSDDLYENNTIIQTLVDDFESNQEIDVIYGDLVYVKRNDINMVVRNWKSKPYFFNFFELGNVPPHPSFFIRRKVIEVVGLFNLRFKIAADYEYMLRILKVHGMQSKYVNKVLVKMRLGGKSNQGFWSIIKQNLEIFHAWQNNNFKVPLLLFPLRFFKKIKQLY